MSAPPLGHLKRLNGGNHKIEGLFYELFHVKAGFKNNGVPFGNGHNVTGFGIPADSALALFNLKNPKTSQLNAVTILQSVKNRIKRSLHNFFHHNLFDSRFLGNFQYNISLSHILKCIIPRRECQEQI